MIMIACVTAVALGSPAYAEEADPGRAAYLKYCSACHGAEGKGDGVVSSALRPRPTDLTQLAKQHGGKYPLVAVIESIDGQKKIAAHGDSEMPVWGEVLFKEGAMADPAAAKARGQVQLIANYVGTIQAH
jgi:mono/diheme cytochrome c family protein